MLSAETHWGNREASGEESSGRSLYNYFRDYDPAGGQYLEADQIGQSGGINEYVYARNNPLRYADVLGRASVTNNLPYPVQASGNPGPGQGSGDQVTFTIQPGQTVNTWNPVYVVPGAPPVTDVDYVNPNGGPVDNSGESSPDKVLGNDVWFQYNLDPTPNSSTPNACSNAGYGKTNLDLIQTLRNIIQNGGPGGTHYW